MSSIEGLKILGCDSLILLELDQPSNTTGKGLHPLRINMVCSTERRLYRNILTRWVWPLQQLYPGSNTPRQGVLATKVE